MATVSSQHLAQATGLYTALFNRAPDTAGLAFWSQALADGADINVVAQGFLSAPEGSTQYPSFQSGAEFVNAFYTKVFGREPDAGGLQFWTTVLNNAGGAQSLQAKASVVNQIVNIVSTQLTTRPEGLTDVEYARTVADRATFANKIDVGQYFASNFAINEADARVVLNNVNNTPESVIAAKTLAYKDALSGNGAIVGTGGDDVFVATLADVTRDGRTFDGGAGNDTLAINADSGSGVILEGKIKNIETVNISTAGNVNVGNIALDKVFTDVRNVNLTGATSATLTGAAGKTIGLLGTGAAVVDFGAASSADILVQNTTGGGTTVNVTGGSLGSVNVTGTGTVTLGGVGAAKTVALNGTGAAPLNVNATALNDVTLDASASSGTVQATVGAGVGYKGGSGADTVTIAAAPTKLLDGGAGDSDVLIIRSNSDVLVASAGNVTGFETLAIGGGNTGTYNASAFKHVLLAENSGNTTFTNVAAGTDLTITSANQNVAWGLANPGGTADSLKINVASNAALNAGTVTAAGVETVNIGSTSTGADAGTAYNTLALKAADATSIVVTGNTGLLLTNDAGNTKVTNVDATASTGGIQYISANTTAGTAVTIKGSATAGNILQGGVTNDTIVGGSGADTLVSGSGLDTLTGGGGNDIFKLGVNANAQTYATITDFNRGDQLDMTATNFIAGATTGNTALTHVTLASTAALNDYVNAAAAVNTASGNGAAGWFQFGGDTYVVIDNTSTANTFTNGADQIVKLTGAVDLSGAVINDHVLTIA